LGEAAFSLWRAFNPPLVATGAALVVLAAAAALLARSTAPGRRLLERLGGCDTLLPRAAFVLAPAYFAAYAYLSVHRHHKLLTWSWDLGIFESLMANALEGRFFVDYRGAFDHLSPAVYLYLPLYAAWRDPRVLLAAQAAVMALAAWPLYLLAREVGGARSLGALAAIVYLLHPMLGAGNLHDLHAVSLTPLFFFSALLFAERERWGLYWLFTVLLLCAKETETILVFSTGLYLLSRRRYLQGALSAAAALVWLAASLWLVLPWIMGEPYWHFGRFGGMAETAEYVIEPEVTPAMLAARRMAQGAAAFFFALLGAAFLPARRWRTLILLFMPVTCIFLVSNNWPLRTLSGHYGVPVTAAALGASAFAMRGVAEGGRRGLVLFVLVTAVLCNLLYSQPAHRRWVYPSVLYKPADAPSVLSLPLPVDRERLEFYRVNEHERFFQAAADAVPPGSSVAAQRNLGAHFAAGYELHDLDSGVRADFFLIDLAEGYGTNTQGLRRFAAALESDAELVRFLTLGEEGEATFVFFARGKAWMDFYARALAAAAQGDPYAAAVARAVAHTRGLPAPPGAGAGGA